LVFLHLPLQKLLIFEPNRDEQLAQSLTAAVVCSMQNNARGQIDDMISQPGPWPLSDVARAAQSHTSASSTQL
jgi:hypothetical protein